MVNSTEQIISNLDFSMTAGAPKYAPRQAVWMDKSARRGADWRSTRPRMREGFSLSSARPSMHGETVWMNKSTRRGADWRSTRPRMREGFSLSSAPPLTEEDKTLLRNCLNSNQNVNQVLRDIVKKNNGTGRGMSN